MAERHPLTISIKDDGQIIASCDESEDEVSPTQKIEQRVCLFCDQAFEIKYEDDGVTPRWNHPWCYDCNLIFSHYEEIWNDDLERRILNAKSAAGQTRTCHFCQKPFNLLKFFFGVGNYDLGELESQALQSWAGSVRGPMDYLFPNLFTEICPDCFRRCFYRDYYSNPKEQLQAVHDLGIKLGKLPDIYMPYYLYSFSTREDVEWFLSIMKHLPDPVVIKNRFGSYFSVLLNAGLLPKGSRRMKLGTQVKAADGHLCFSIAEKEIDDWLSGNGIRHRKEVAYPESSMRCDWEIVGAKPRIFIEYFGLMSKEAYANKTKEKIRLASKHGISLLEIYPETDWPALLEQHLGGFRTAKGRKRKLRAARDFELRTAQNDLLFELDEDTNEATLFAFIGNHSDVTSLSIPTHVKIHGTTCPVVRIGKDAFAGCLKLKSVSLPPLLRIIERNAFLNCQELTTISLPDGLETIGNHAFDGCGLTSATIPGSVTKLGDSSFASCFQLQHLDIRANTTIIPPHFCRACFSLESIVLPDQLESIQRDAFVECKELTKVTFPSQLKAIQEGAFVRCFKLDSVSLCEGFESIGKSAFAYCSGLQVVSLPKTLKQIGEYAFIGCKNLSNISLPEIPNVGRFAFGRCPKLAAYNLPEWTASWPEMIFESPDQNPFLGPSSQGQLSNESRG